MSGACEVWFYHLERTALDRALPDLLERTLARGWRAQVRSPDPQRIDHLDGWLWTYRDDSFLPHGTADEADAARQPILLAHAPIADTSAAGTPIAGTSNADTSGADTPIADTSAALAENRNGAQALFLLDDAAPLELNGYERCIVLFDGGDAAALAAARGRWRDVKAAGYACTYWRQSERGAWEKQA